MRFACSSRRRIGKVMTDPTSAKCHARMEQGFVVDHNAGIAEPEWADGAAPRFPRKSAFC